MGITNKTQSVIKNNEKDGKSGVDKVKVNLGRVQRKEWAVTRIKINCVDISKGLIMMLDYMYC